MKLRNRKIVLIVSCLLSICGRTQDIHFSSTGFNPMFFNPSMTAFMNNRFRFSTIYRNQWQTVSPGYNTFFASLEAVAYANIDYSRCLGLGVGFTSDVAGSLSFGERDIAVSGSYYMSLDRHNRTYISFGVQAMRKNWSVDIQKAEFNREGSYDDQIRYDNLSTFDVSFGAALQYASDEQHLFYAGVACFHVNRPSMSYFDDTDLFLHRRFFANLSYMFPFSDSESLSLNPQIFFQHQNNFNELLAGGEILLDLDNSVFNRKIMSLGLHLRNTEAIVVSPKFRYNDFCVGLSYDVNISKLNKVSHTYGAVELWLNYSFNIHNYEQQTTKIPCPIF